MKNIIKEKPTDKLHGRALYNTKFVLDDDLKNKKILDIGCGFGWFELNAISRGCENITGIEITEKDLETAKKYLKNEKISLRTGSAIDLPFEDKSFDTVVLWEVIEHIPKNKEDKMFQEIKRVLKDRGIFYLSTPYNSLISKIFDPAWWLIGHRHYSKEKLILLAQDNGFKIETVVLNGGWWEIFGINNLYIAKWIFKRKPFLKDFFDKKQDREYEEENGFTNVFMKFNKA